MKNRESGRKKTISTGSAATIRISIFKNAAVKRRVPAATLCMMLAALCMLPAARTGATANDGSVNLLETGSASKPVTPPNVPAELKFISYNIRWRGGEDLQKLATLLRDDAEIGGASVIGLQEVDRNKERTDFANTARLLAESLGMNYAWAAPPTEEKEEETGVAVLSRYKLTDVERIVLRHEGPNKRRRAAVGVTAHIGEMPVRFYSMHAETRMPLEKKITHWQAVLEDLERYPKISRAVIVGDFNTIKKKDVRAARRLFTEAGFTTPFDDSKKTWKTLIFELKLDWIWLRGFGEATRHGIDKEIKLSDHWPLWAVVDTGKKEANAEPATPPLPRVR